MFWSAPILIKVKTSVTDPFPIWPFRQDPEPDPGCFNSRIKISFFFSRVWPGSGLKPTDSYKTGKNPQFLHYLVPCPDRFLFLIYSTVNLYRKKVWQKEEDHIAFQACLYFRQQIQENGIAGTSKILLKSIKYRMSYVISYFF